MYDKVTKVDSIAKRKAWSKVNQGVLVEHKDAYHRDARNLYASFTADNTHAQMTVTVTKKGKMFRREQTVAAGVTTSWPSNPGKRKARKIA